eukprot:Lithocolla_globosa_v1_NODE_357_length_4326_cov_202.120815.p5 type:complete len:103 gc:universal NODE_357_length_4326_cov_202.120815:1845-1537(-)
MPAIVLVTLWSSNAAFLAVPHSTSSLAPSSYSFFFSLWIRSISACNWSCLVCACDNSSSKRLEVASPSATRSEWYSYFSAASCSKSLIWTLKRTSFVEVISF